MSCHIMSCHVLSYFILYYLILFALNIACFIQVDLPELQGEPLDIAVEKCRIAVEKLGKINVNPSNTHLPRYNEDILLT